MKAKATAMGDLVVVDFTCAVWPIKFARAPVLAPPKNTALCIHLSSPTPFGGAQGSASGPRLFWPRRSKTPSRSPSALNAPPTSKTSSRTHPKRYVNRSFTCF